MPTIATMVPRAAFTSVTGRLRKELKVPVITSNRINMPAVAEDGAGPRRRRPGLDGAADAGRPELVNKGDEGREDEINTCIACNQACLDHTFGGNKSGELPGQPAPCHETRAELSPDGQRQAHRRGRRRAGRAGLRRRGGAARPPVTLFEAGSRDRRAVQPGAPHPGQGKFNETLRYFPPHDRSARHRPG